MPKVAMPNLYIEIERTSVMVDKDACIVAIDVSLDGKVKTITASSKRCPGDKPDDRVAIPLAYARALNKASAWLNRQANAQLSQNDELIRVRPIQAASKAKWLKAVAKKNAKIKAKKRAKASN